jgi:hypothetical protein
MIAPDNDDQTPAFLQVSTLVEAEENIRGGGNDSSPGVGHRGAAPHAPSMRSCVLREALTQRKR